MTTRRCEILPLSMEHFSSVEKLYQNTEVRRYLGGLRKPLEVKKQLEHMLKQERHHYWIVGDKYTHLHLGMISLTPHHCETDIEISYQFFPNVWGKGYASETIYEVLLYALFHLDEQKIVAETQRANERSCKLLETLGMTIDRYVYRFGAQQVIYKLNKNRLKINDIC